MDPVSIIALASSAWKIIGPYAGKLLEKTTESVPPLVVKIWDFVKHKMEAKPNTSTLPGDLASAPDNHTVQNAFQDELKKLLENDETFAQELQKLVQQAKSSGISANVQVAGNGVVATGDHAAAVGDSGVMVTGNVTGGINTGVRNEMRSNKKKKR